MNHLREGGCHGHNEAKYQGKHSVVSDQTYSHCRCGHGWLNARYSLEASRHHPRHC